MVCFIVRDLLLLGDKVNLAQQLKVSEERLVQKDRENQVLQKEKEDLKSNYL